MQNKTDFITHPEKLDHPAADSPADSTASRQSTRAPWYCYTIVLGSLSIAIGILWDISWHRSIGRDTFWTPAHLAIHFGGIIGGIVSGYLILFHSFWKKETNQKTTVAIGPLRAPTGAWVCLFGNWAMLTSAPFDDWWHNAYGLDVKIISPPHMVLALGMFSVVFGGLLLLAQDWNNSRNPASTQPRSPWLMVLGGGILLAMAATVLIEISWPNQYRHAEFLIFSCATYPFYLLGIAKATRWRWAGTAIAFIYMMLVAGMAWILPLFKAQPLLGPIYNPVDYFVPLPFPLLLIVPGFFLDLLRWKLEARSGFVWNLVLIMAGALIFSLSFYVSQFFFGEFLLSEKAHNWFFAADRHWGYQEQQNPWRQSFWGPQVTQIWKYPAVLISSLGACTFSVLAGHWLGHIRR
ncbi:MAG: hypothetical protein LR011_00955 [Verrucomicrobia bacterium]|nr:hypothetical protein [Verrucomicrobiota bacterium]